MTGCVVQYILIFCQASLLEKSQNSENNNKTKQHKYPMWNVVLIILLYKRKNGNSNSNNNSNRFFRFSAASSSSTVFDSSALTSVLLPACLIFRMMRWSYMPEQKVNGSSSSSIHIFLLPFYYKKRMKLFFCFILFYRRFFTFSSWKVNLYFFYSLYIIARFWMCYF